MSQSKQTFRISISGLVQGVGFRPFIWRLANEMNLAGRVLNDSEGVKIDVNCDEEIIKDLVQRIKSDLPPLAKIDQIYYRSVEYINSTSFSIDGTEQGVVATGCAPDAATCNNCLSELFDPGNRRYRYPFINCTDCGPRLSIIKQIPYDREFTTMAEFQQCSECFSEYNNPADHRFHAQPNACSVCGPKVWLEDNCGKRLKPEDVFNELSAALTDGKIIALKGLGGFHLACDATNSSAVEKLRSRKHRPDKAFALMVRDLEILGRYAEVSSNSEKIISGHQAPVVLLDPVANPDRPVSHNVASGQYQLGFMLPYTPIHHLMMESIEVPLVMTSGNQSGSPQAISNKQAREQLSEIVDLFLMHDRDIQNRVDDSVVRQVGDEVHILRRARGYAPGSLALPKGFEKAPNLIALGGELKNTICLIQSGRAIVTQHLGDLEDFRTYEQYQNTLNLYRNLYQFETDLYVCDLHPEYLSSKYGEELAERGSDLIKVQHHHAHLASCLGENGYALDGDPVLGICLDGTGFGSDETLWGGEFLLGGYFEFQRVAHIKPFPLVGGVKAIIEPWRCLYAQLRQGFPDTDPQHYQELFPVLASPVCSTLNKMIKKQLNCPMTSSAGRLFDAVAAALGCHAEGITYEGQAAIELETLAMEANREVKPYPFTVEDNQIDPSPFWASFIKDLQYSELSKSEMAMAFHKGFVAALVRTTESLKQHHTFSTVALTGGVMQNSIIYSSLKAALITAGFEVLTHNQLPANDAGLSYGQALIGAARKISS